MRGSVFGKTLRDQRRSIAGWTIAIAAVGVLYAAFWPLMMSPEMKAAMDAFPPEFMEALGYTDVTTAAGYVGSTTFGLLGPALIIIYAAATGGAAIAGEEESGRLDLLLAHPVSRWSVLLQRSAALIVGMLLACAALAVALIAISGPAELGDIGAANLVAASLHLALLGVFYGAVALGFGAATGRRSIAWAAVAILAIGGFLGNNLAPMVDALAWLRDISPFHFYAGAAPLRNGIQPIDAMVLILASAGLIAVGGLRFDRRDVAV